MFVIMTTIESKYFEWIIYLVFMSLYFGFMYMSQFSIYSKFCPLMIVWASHDSRLSVVM